MQDLQPWGDPSALAELVAFVAVAEQGSFKQAARRVGRDPTVLSRRLDALEQRLGVRLLERTTRALHTTEAGALMLERARSVLEALRDAEEELRTQEVARGRLRLALPSTFSRLWIAPALPAFLAAQPGLRLEVQLTNRYVDLVREGFDAAVRIGELRSSSLVARKLSGLQRLLCAAPSYLAARGTPRKPEELRAHDALLFTGSASYPLWRLQHAQGEQATVRPEPRYVSDDAEALREAALAGLGIMLATDWLVGRELADGRLVRVLPRWSTADRAAIYAVTPSARVPRKTRVFLDWIAERFRRPPWR